MTSRVVPAIGVTMARRVPVNAIEERRLADVGAADEHDGAFSGDVLLAMS